MVAFRGECRSAPSAVTALPPTMRCPSPDLLDVKVPAGAFAGMQFTARSADGRSVDIFPTAWSQTSGLAGSCLQPTCHRLDKSSASANRVVDRFEGHRDGKAYGPTGAR